MTSTDPESARSYPICLGSHERTYAIRKIIYTTNAIESLNYQLRKVTKTRGHFPTEDAVLKILYLAIRNIGNNRGGELGTGTQGWKQALNAFAITFPGRLDPTT